MLLKPCMKSLMTKFPNGWSSKMKRYSVTLEVLNSFDPIQFNFYRANDKWVFESAEVNGETYQRENFRRLLGDGGKTADLALLNAEIWVDYAFKHPEHLIKD